MRKFLMAGMLAFTALAGMASAEPVAPPYIEVQGQGEVTVAPDMAFITLGVTHRAPQAREAMASVNEGMAAILQRLEKQGVAEADLQTSQLTVTIDHNTQMYNSESLGVSTKPQYVASSMLNLRVRDLDRLGAMIDLALEDGANQMSGLRFAVESPEPLEAQARRLAVENAAGKAAELAEAAGVALGPVRRITSSGQSGAPQMMHMARSSGAAIASGEVTISAHVSMVYDIQQ